MIQEETRYTIGRVLRASTTGFDCGTRGTRIDDKHTLGAFVKVPVNEERTVWAIGLIYAIRIDDDPLARELVMASGIDNNILMDQRENRMVPVEICVINIGCVMDGYVIHNLPPRPPMSLVEVDLCYSDEIYAFTQQSDYFRLILNAKEIPSDELLVAALRYAQAAYPAEEREAFLIRSGQHLVRLLSHDLRRLQHVLMLIHP